MHDYRPAPVVMSKTDIIRTLKSEKQFSLLDAMKKDREIMDYILSLHPTSPYDLMTIINGR